MSTAPDTVEIRILGSLLEKQRTTPEAYPLSVNSLRLACNQSTNRDPVVDYDDHTLLEALERLSRRRWVRLTSGVGSRARKYRQLLGDALELDEPELALLCVLMLRGPQTPGELKQRAGRLHRFADLAAVDEALDGLVERELARALERRPGQKEERFEQLVGEPDEEEEEEDTDTAQPLPTGPDRLDRLEQEVAALRDELARLRDDLGA